MPVPPLKFPTELIVLRDVKNNIPLRKNVPGVNVLIISFLSALKYESGSAIGLLGSGGSSFSLSGGGSVIGIKLDRFYFKLKSEK